MPNIRDVFELREVRTNIPTVTVDLVPFKVPSEELIGIEVEVENVQRVGKIDPLWHMTEDGSLRNHGREFITDPMPAKYAPAMLHNLLEALGQECSFTPRTSVHIHVNAQDLTSEQVSDMLILYTLFERVLYRYVGRSRIRNPYCVPIAETYLLNRFVQRGLKAQWEKYAGFNILPLRDKGTVEFRHMHGTFDVQKLAGWVDLVTSLKEYVKKTPTKVIRRMMHTITVYDVEALGREVFPSCYHLLKWDRVEEKSIFATKYCLASASSFTAVRAAVTSDSPFFKVKD